MKRRSTRQLSGHCAPEDSQQQQQEPELAQHRVKDSGNSSLTTGSINFRGERTLVLLF